MSVKIEIRDTTNNIIGTLDIEQGENNPFSMTKKIADYNDIEVRSGSYSTDFNVPVTDNNAQLLRSLRHANTKNVAKFWQKKDAILYINDIELERGFIKVNGVSKEEGVDYYNMTFFSGNSDWSIQFGDMAISDITFDSSLLPKKTFANIGATWGNDETNEYIYSWFERGGITSTYNQVVTNPAGTDGIGAGLPNFYPDIFLHALVHKAFNTLGYTVNSSFFNLPKIRGLVMTYFNEGGSSEALKQYTADNVRAGATAIGQTCGETKYEFTWNGYNYVFAYSNLPINDDTLSPNTDPEGNFNTSNQTFTAPDDGFYTLSWNHKYDTSNASGGKNTTWGSDTVAGFILETSAPIQALGGNLVDTSGLYERNRYVFSSNNDGLPAFPSGSSVGSVANNWNKKVRGQFQIYVYLSQGQAVRGDIMIYKGGGTISELWKLQNEFVDYQIGGTSFNANFTARTQFESGSLADFYNSRQNTVTLKQIMSDLTKMFNLHWRTNNATKNVWVEPFIDFYDAIADAIDVTDKIDASSYELEPVSKTYARYHKFEYADPKEDKHLSERDKYKEKYGSYTHDLGSEFEDKTKKVKLEVFTAGLPTNNPLFVDESDLPTPSTMTSNVGTEIHSTTNLRWGLPKLLNKRLSEKDKQFYTSEPYNNTRIHTQVPILMMHKTYAENQTMPVSQNMMFGDYDGDDGLYTDYYEKSIDLIKNSKRLKIKMRFSLKDFKKIDFNKVMYISAPEEIQGYWIFEEIRGIAPQNSEMVKVKLVQWKNFEASPADMTTEGNKTSSDLYNAQEYTGDNLENNVDNIFIPTGL